MGSKLPSLFGLLLGRGSSRNDLIIGSDRAERFDAKSGNDWINAAGGDDTVVGGKGNDFVAGGPGTDTAVLSGSVRSYSWVTLPFTGAPGPLGFAGNLIRIKGPDGVDWLRDIEYLRFNDALIRVGNAAPLAVADAYRVDEDATLSVLSGAGVLANDDDPDNDGLRALLVADVGHGRLDLKANGSFTYVPDANFAGSDSFTYKVNDGTSNGNTVTVSIAVSNTGVAAPDLLNLTSLASGAGFKITGELGMDFAGKSVSSAGDFNNDGFDDLLVGAFGNAAGGNSAGAAYVILSSGTPPSAVNLDDVALGSGGFKITGVEGDQAGKSVSSAGDFNGDGFDDLIVGAPYNDPDGGNIPGAGLCLVRQRDAAYGGECRSDCPGCPSSGDLRPFRFHRNGGSGSSGFEVMRPVVGAASVFAGWSGA